MMNSRERASLDRYITGNYGEDQFKHESRVDERIESYEDYEAVVAGRLLRAYDMEWTPGMSDTLYQLYEAGLSVDAATAEMVGE